MSYFVIYQFVLNLSIALVSLTLGAESLPACQTREKFDKDGSRCCSPSEVGNSLIQLKKNVRMQSAELSQHCQSFCFTHAAEWATKCNWKKCQGCADCSTLAPCQSTCSKNLKLWATKCSWKNCKGCADCSASASCKTFCTTSTKSWGSKCKWRKCQGCASCTSTPQPEPEPTETPTALPTETPTEEPTPSPTEEPTEEPTRSPTEEPTPSLPSPTDFMTQLHLPKDCSDVVANQVWFPWYWGTLASRQVILSTDYSTYQDDLEDNGRGPESFMYDRRDGKFHSFPNTLRLSCTFMYHHLNSDPTIYSVWIRANPNDYINHSEVRAALSDQKLLEALGRLPEILFRNLRTLTVHAGSEPWGGNQWLGDVLAYTGNYKNSALEEVLFHEATHASIDGWLSLDEYKQAIEDDCDEFYSTYARDYPEREGIAESFLIYYGARYFPSRFQGNRLQEATRIGPNRMKFFEHNLDQALSSPPLEPSMHKQKADAPNQKAHAPSVNTTNTANQKHTRPPAIQLSPEEMKQAAASYLHDSEFFESLPDGDLVSYSARG